MLYCIQIRTEVRSCHDSDVVLLGKVPGDFGSVDAGIVLPEHVMLVTAKIGHNVKSKDLIDIPQSRDVITRLHRSDERASNTRATTRYFEIANKSLHLPPA